MSSYAKASIHSSSAKNEYYKVVASLERLQTAVNGLIAPVLQNNAIDFLSVQTRIKSDKSFEDKVSRKQYEKPISEITDLLGARVIVYLESDVERVTRILRQLFDIDEVNSVDKSRLQPNQVGYRSVHLVCSLGARRSDFIEYDGLLNQRFEIQIRTALQHAWAEIEHKQQYKSAASLPPSLNRKLMLLAGTLENLDSQFSAIVHDAVNYKELVKLDTKSVQDDPLSAQALMALFSQLVDKLRLDSKIFVVDDISFSEEIISRLNGLGLHTISDLRKQLYKISEKNYSEFGAELLLVNTGKLFNFLMMSSFPDAYMNLCLERNVKRIDGRVLNYFDTHHPEFGVGAFVETVGLKIN